MAGFGAMPAGFGPFGIGTPLAAPEPPNGPAGSRYINPATGDYEIDGITGQLKQMPAARQRVLLALRTLRKSSSTAPSFGIVLPGKMGTSFEAEVNQNVRLALRHLTEVEKVVGLDFINVERGAGGRARVTVGFTDLTTGERDEASSPI